ncbi:MAG TPA: UDP-N-acetylmuramoyl-tripeptide--D-alanyl-D-alanine ligase, partial [Gammaproteobacteria bacterium]|nr:UDP-N-acetylmuramoyl-tripeptide--D-alanyl-D-alanine ligase [Gammaproteobacteria bacterium]
ESDADTTFQGISTDTRTLTPGNLFIALRGEQFDGHHFAEKAVKMQAAALLLEKPVIFNIPQIIVKDTYAALGKMAAAWRAQFTFPFVGVTGSNGKTTLKNMLATILQEAANPYQILATKGNLNNHIGLPLTLCQLSEKQRFAVIEMGMNHLGEIAYLTQLAKPTVAIITNAAESHLEGVKDLTGVAKAKGEIFLGLPKDGVAILNRDDQFYSYWKNLIGEHSAISFGFDKNADVHANIKAHNHMTIHTPNGGFEVQLPLLGKHNGMNALAATAACLALKIDFATIKKGLEKVAPEPGRMQPYFLSNDCLVINDTYNANPFSLQAAINALATYQKTKILVLGDMRELGPEAQQYHQNMGKKIREAGVDYLFTTGELSLATAETFGKNATHFEDKDKLISALQPFIKKDTVILVKGSRSMRMEKIIAAIVPAYQEDH